MPELLVIGIVAVTVLAVGIGLGILVAKAISRWADRDEEEPGDQRDQPR